MAKRTLFMFFALFALLPMYAQNPDNLDEEEYEVELRQELFCVYGNLGDIFTMSISNETASVLIPKLEYGCRKWNNAACQFMLGCVYSGHDTVYDFDEDYNKIPRPLDEDYKYYNKKKAAIYFLQFLDNPSKTIMPFGYKMDDCIQLLSNAFGGDNVEIIKRNLKSFAAGNM